MPPFLVEVDALDWLYSKSPGLEILSAGKKDETEAFIRDLRNNLVYLHGFIPDDFLFHTALPTTLILFPRSLTDRLDKEMARELEELSTASNDRSRFVPMNDLRLSDPDSSYIFVILRDWQWRTNQSMGIRGPPTVCSPAHLRFLIDSRAPPLPEWYSVGVSALYKSSGDPFSNGPPIERSSVGVSALYTSSPFSDSLSFANNSTEDFEPDPWLSEDAARVLRSYGGAPRPLLPMRELLVPTIPAGKSEEYRRVWEAQSELFVRWAYSGNVAGGRDRLRRFVAAAATQPITQELFQSCFGMNYADARDALSDFLAPAVQKPLKVPWARTTALQPVEVRDATPGEIHRIKGEWARRTLRIIKENYPHALPLYVEKTRRLLQRSYDRGERDPQLLASLALFRIDIGDTAAGRGILEEHPEAVAARPMAGLARAQLQLLDALQQPAGLNGMLSEDQAARILGAVWATLQPAPPIEGAYMLAARVLKHLGRDPTDRERALIDEGARLFPRNPQLAIDCASWDLRAGDVFGAHTLIELALWESSDPSAREKLSILEDLARKASLPSDKTGSGFLPQNRAQ
jgi:hypothetical protein